MPSLKLIVLYTKYTHPLHHWCVFEFKGAQAANKRGRSLKGVYLTRSDSMDDLKVSEEPSVNPQSTPSGAPIVEGAAVSHGQIASNSQNAVLTEKMNSWQVSGMPEPKQYFCLDVSHFLLKW